MTHWPDIEQLIPHREGMLLIDTILEVDKDHARTRTRVKPDWPLVRDGGVSAIVLIELAAQSAGVCFGWQAMHSPDSGPSAPAGWLVGVKRADFRVGTVPVGARLVIRTENRLAAENYKEIGACITMDDTEIAQIHLQVLQADKTAFSDVAG